MKKKLLPLALAAAAGLTGVTAQAQMHVNANGTGDLLMYPIYTANGGNDTYISLANTTNDYKAVKVRFVDAMNSQDSLDFHLYLSPLDHWSGVVTKDAATGGAILKTGDSSCTVPNSLAATKTKPVGASAPMRTAKYGTGGAEADAKNNGIDRTLEGHIEVIEMGILPKTTTGGVSGTVVNNPSVAAATDFSSDASKALGKLKAAIKHVGGYPGNCASLEAAWTQDNTGTLDDAAGAFYYTDGNTTPGDFNTAEISLEAPTGGLYGYGVIINVPDGTAAMFDAVAVEGFMANGYHPTPGDDEPGLDDGVNTAVLTQNDGTSLALTFDPAATARPATDAALTTAPLAAGDTSDRHVNPKRGVTGSRLIGGGNQSTVGTIATVQAGSKEAVSAILMKTSVSNDYVLDAGLNAATDWVVTFPTKRDFVNLAAGDTTAGATAAVTAAAQFAAERPFTNLWSHANTEACEVIGISYRDREEGVATISTSFDFSPAPVTTPTSVALCTESNIVNFATGNNVLAGSSRITKELSLASGFVNGWATVSFGAATHTLSDNASANTVTGLPVIGFAIQKYVNGSAGGAGVLANYAGSIGHHYTQNN